MQPVKIGEPFDQPVAGEGLPDADAHCFPIAVVQFLVGAFQCRQRGHDGLQYQLTLWRDPDAGMAAGEKLGVEVVLQDLYAVAYCTGRHAQLAGRVDEAVMPGNRDERRKSMQGWKLAAHR